MKATVKVVSLCSAALLGLVLVTAPAQSQVAGKLKAKPQPAPRAVGNVTLKRGLFARPANSRAEATLLLDQMRAASAELKELAERNRRAPLRDKGRAAAHRDSLSKIRAVANNLDAEIVRWEKRLSTAGDDAQLANIDLQNMLQKQQQTLQTLSGVSKMMHDTAMAIVRKIG